MKRTASPVIWLLPSFTGTAIYKFITCAAALIAAGTINSSRAAYTWDFDKGMQDWKNTMVSTNPALSFTALASFGGWDGEWLPALGAQFLGQSIDSHNGPHQSLCVQSPPFHLDGSGDLTFRATGATGTPGAITTIPANSSPDGRCGVCLRRDTGEFVLTKQIAGDGGDFEIYTIPASELAPFVNDGHSYTLNVVDYLDGTDPNHVYYIAVDNVSVPGKLAGYMSFDFEDGTMQGWTNSMVSTAELINGNQYADLSFAAVTHVGGPTGQDWDAQDGHFLGQTPNANSKSGLHKTICVESPRFTLNGLGDLTFRMDASKGFVRDGYALPNPLKPLAGGWESEDVCAVGLRRDDGTFVLTQVPGDWVAGFFPFTFTKDQLAQYVNDGHTYTLCAVDTLAGTYAWIAIDDVNIPGDRLKNSQLITGFGSMTNRPPGAYNLATECAGVSASSELPVSFRVASGPAVLSGSILTVTNLGTVTVTAVQPGNESYLEAPSVSATFQVLNVQSVQTISFSALSNQPYEASFTLSAIASSQLPVSYTISGAAVLNGNTVICTNGVGSVTVTASQPGNPAYLAATPVSQTFLVTNAPQVITFSAIAEQDSTNVLALAATASSSLPVTYTVVGPAVLSGTNLTFTAIGTVTVTAHQAGSPLYLPAPDVSQTFNVTRYLRYLFSDGTMQGWTNLMASYETNGFYDLSFAVQDVAGSWGTPDGIKAFWGTTPESLNYQFQVPSSVPLGRYILSQAPFTNDSRGWHAVRDANYSGPIWPEPGSGAHQTLWVQSPPFYLNASGPLTYWGSGSEGAINAASGTNQLRNISLTNTPVPAIAGTWGAETGHPAETSGTCAVGLRRDDGTFVLSRNFVNWGNQWDLYSFTAEELAPFVNDGHKYTLNMIDMLTGTGAWCSIGNIAIPGETEAPTPVPTVQINLKADGSALVLTWAPTVAGLPCTVLSSTSVAAPLSSWSTAATVTTTADSTSVEIPLPNTATFFQIKY